MKNFLINTAKNSIYSVLKYVVIILICFFVFKLIWSNWTQLSSYSFEFELKYAIISIFILALFNFINCLGWGLILKSNGIKASYKIVLYNWFISNLGKYLPGKIWAYSGRVYLHSALDHSKKKVISSCILETVYIVAASSLVCLLLLKITDSFDYYFYLLILLLLCLFFLVPKVFQNSVNYVLKILAKEPVEFNFRFYKTITIIMVYVSNYCVVGLAFYFFTRSFVLVPFQDIFFLTFSLVFSSLLGYLAFFIPLGLGVRESSFIILLSKVYPIPTSILIALSSRLWFVLTELFIILLIWAIYKLPLKNNFIFPTRNFGKN